MRKLLFVLALSAALWPAETHAQAPFTRTGLTVSRSASTSSANVALVTNSPTLWTCNVGSNTAYINFGDSTVVASTTAGTPIPAGLCANLSPAGGTHMAAITDTGTSTVLGTPGNGSLVGSGGGSGSGGGGGAVQASPAISTATLTSWTSATALNAMQTLMPINTVYGAAVLLQLDQSTTISAGAVTIEGTYDGTNWVTIPVAQVLNPNTLAVLTNPYTLVASTNQPFLILGQGYQSLRIKLSTQITGSGTVTPYVTLLPFLPVDPALLNPLVTQAPTVSIGGMGIIDSAGVNTASVKAASTAPVATDKSVVVAPNPNAGTPANLNQYPFGAIPYTATATGTTGATTATLAGAASVTTYLCGFSIRSNATAVATGNATVTGVITATMNFTHWTAPNASGIGLTEMIFTPCVPASGTNQSVAVVSPAPGTGGVVSVTAWGYKL